MKLLTKAIENKLPKFYETEDIPEEEKIAQIKFFTTWNSWRWYGVEYNPDTRMFFGWVDGDFPEWGYFSLDEISQVRGGPFKMPIERDMWVTPKQMKDVENYS